MATAAAIFAAAGAGLWAGQNGVIKLPTTSAEAESTAKPVPMGPVVYYRDPTGKPFYSLEPKASDDGQPYLAIHASEDVSFDLKSAAETKEAVTTHGEKKIKYYRNPMGLLDTSPVPKKDSMGMDYIPVYEGEESDDSSIKVSPGKIQRSGVETVEVAKRPMTRTVQAPGAVQLDERRVTVVAPRFDGYIANVGAPTSGTRVKQGDVLVTLFGQELLNWGARLIIEQGYGFRPADEAFIPPGLKSEGSGVIGARRRLENLGAPQEFVDAIKDT
jgi:Cu(I)/Ag(I) efflux system membrane fusion protein